MDYSLLFAVEQINFRNSEVSIMDSSNNMIKQLLHDLASDPKQIQRQKTKRENTFRVIEGTFKKQQNNKFMVDVEDENNDFVDFVQRAGSIEINLQTEGTDKLFTEVSRNTFQDVSVIKPGMLRNNKDHSSSFSESCNMPN